MIPIDQRRRGTFRLATVATALIFALGLVTLTPHAAMAQTNTPIVYPAQGQSTQQQSQDEAQCRTWAQEQTGFNPYRGAPTYSSSSGGDGGSSGRRARRAARRGRRRDRRRCSARVAIGAGVGATVGAVPAARQPAADEAAQQQATAQYKPAGHGQPSAACLRHLHAGPRLFGELSGGLSRQSLTSDSTKVVMPGLDPGIHSAGHRAFVVETEPCRTPRPAAASHAAAGVAAEIAGSSPAMTHIRADPDCMTRSAA
jgi:hypothetical protein